MKNPTAEQVRVCQARGVPCDPPSEGNKLGIALATLHLRPLNGLRHPPAGGTSGWYIWGGEDLPEDPDFFQPLHHAHLQEMCPEVMRYMALPPGWRFLTADPHEDIWSDAGLLFDDSKH
jgi:hypothetical protein